MSITERSDMSKSDPQSGMVTVTIAMTPEQAQEWLDSMPVQRRLRKSKVEKLLRLVNEGRWKLLPHGLVVDRDGCLRDGQHRCKVGILSGKTLPVRVTFNVDPAVYLDIDDGTAAKTLEDMLRYEGVPPGLTTIISDPIRMVFREERGFSPLTVNLSPSNQEGLEIYRRHPRLLKAGELASKCRLAPSRSTLCFAIYKGLLADDEITEIFTDQVAAGEGLRLGDPALLLRNTWISDRTKMVKREKGDQLTMALASLTSAINGQKRQSWRGVEFGKGKIPQIKRKR